MPFATAQDTIAHLDARPVRHLVDGELVDGPAGFDVVDPATGRPAARSPGADVDLLDRAVAAARRAQPAWGDTPRDDRRRALERLAEVLDANVPELAALVTLEQGRPLAAARQEIVRAAAMLRELVAIHLDDDVLRDDARGRVVMRHRPLGVIGAIAPWNVPIGLAVPKIAHALLTGNAVVLKPSPCTPLATLRLGELARALFPRGVLNILAGGNEVGERMSLHPDIAKISLTGSIVTGRRVMAAAAGSLKRLTLELGGNDAAIVLADADVEQVAPQLFAGAFVNSGQVCMAIKRLYVHRSIHQRMAQALAGMAKRTRLGPGFDPDVQMGPVQNLAQFESVRRVLADVAARPQARVLAGGKAVAGPGYFIEPTVVTGLVEGTPLVDEETFGPVLPVLAFDTVDEAVARANLGPYGLAASVWSPDLDRAAAVADRLLAGTVWINRHVGADPGVPFGGFKASGLGVQWGREGLLACMQSSAIYLPPGARPGVAATSTLNEK